ncbi:FtsH protease activity modulator HflK [bacterium]|nr:FtsH protease activity modulator HflK [candidate division CSSED10-310 bacterium]
MARKKKSTIPKHVISEDSHSFLKQYHVIKRILKTAGLGFSVLAFLLYFSTCFSHVRIQETGVILRFGKVVRDRVPPGICLKWPWPVDRLMRVKTQAIQTLETGFGADQDKIAEFEKIHGPIDMMEYGTLRIEYALTGDKNIIHVKVLVTYKIGDPETYLFHVKDAENIAASLTRFVIIQNIVEQNVDEILTTGRLALRQSIQNELENLLKQIPIGLDINTVEIRNVRPPSKTTFAFKDVINAQEESRELIHQAESYRNSIIPEAQAEAQKVYEEALAYKNQKIAYAEGESQRFSLLVTEYRNNPGITMERLRLEALETILPNLKKSLLDEHDNRIKLRLFTGMEN